MTLHRPKLLPLLCALAGCGYSSHWPDLPEGTTDTGPLASDAYHQTGTPPCSTADPGRAPSRLTMHNAGAVPFAVTTTDPATCLEEPFTTVAVGGSFVDTVDTNLVFVVRGPDGGLVRWFGVPPGSDWVEVLP